MTVAELIANLKAMPQQLVVVIPAFSEGYSDVSAPKVERAKIRHGALNEEGVYDLSESSDWEMSLVIIDEVNSTRPSSWF